MEERLQKILAHAGLASRRACEELIASGKVKVNGQVVRELGVKVDGEKSIIEVEGRQIKGPESLVYILLNKPRGYVSTAFDPQGRPTVLDLVGDVKERIYPVGRLDYDTSGLLILTNDGSLTNELIHPSKEVTKTYQALVRGWPSEAKLDTLRKGLQLEDGRTAPAEVKILKKQNGGTMVEIKIHEGRNRQVRRMFEKIGHPVIRLHRSMFAFLTLGKLNPGEWRYLTPEEAHKLKNLKKK